MIGFPIVFRCCECTVEEQTMEHLESHIWSRHLQAFPFRCSYCDFPALSSVSLIEHFAQEHAEVTIIEFKRNLEDEKRFRKMVSESIAIEIEENSQHDTSSQLTELQPMMQQGTTQLMLLPSHDNQYASIVDHRVSQDDDEDEDDFGVLEDDENVEELLEDDDEEYMEELGNPVFIGAGEGSNFILADDMEQQSSLRATNSYHLKYIRTRRMDKLIDNVAAQRNSPDSTSNSRDDVTYSTEDENGVKRFNCDQCERSFKFQSKLDEHRRTHLGLRPFQCDRCHRQFTQKGALKTHMRLHTGERPFFCQWDCGKQFPSSSARRHHEKTHSGERPYICSVCSKSFTKNSHVIRHLKNIHNREIIQEDALLRGDYTTAEETASHIVDINPRGEERHAVHDIVERIHEEKNFAEQKAMPFFSDAAS
ncbi:CBN-ZTF-23 protein [Caenorhabditis brenneri]|uniref:CBN-ZTF-23 protein n=1 Tax=Caenorhabditis brenneri TaxID=135651 RepID=G0P0Y8_CAEBE|nr:CBN-ZTF-23 protein [Caenorhabditis brenneri]